MRFKGLDLNLLVALSALMETRSVSRAADRLNLSQPALSSALRRLREFFHDDLFVAHGKKMVPTAFADSLFPSVKECLLNAETLVSTTSSFDPETSQRVFKIVASDYAIASVFAKTSEEIARCAPGIGLDFRLPDDHVWDDLESGVIDLYIMPQEFISNRHPSEVLFEETHVVAGWSENPLLHQPLSIDDFFGAGQVAASFGRKRQPSHADGHVAALGRQRLIEVTVPAFTLLPAVLVRTMRLALMHGRLARVMAEQYAIAWQPTPFKLPVMREMAQFHSSRIADEGLRWLRSMVQQTARATLLLP